MSSYNNNEALMERQTFIVPDNSGSNGVFSQDELVEDRDGLQISFPKVKIPAGGALQYEIPGDDPENPDMARTIEGVILFTHPSYACWQEGSEYDDNSTPLCTSVDGKTGIGQPGGVCATCLFNQFGSAPDGRGKACKNMRAVYLLRSGEPLPLQIMLPPTSLRPYSDFYNLAFAIRNRATYGSIVQMSLKRVDNGKNLYSIAVFKKVRDLSEEELLQIKPYVTAFREQVRMLQQQRAADAEARNEELFAEADYTVESGDGTFCITADAIDGDREALPA